MGLPLTSASTDQQCEQAFEDNCAYWQGSGSVSMAQAYAQACNFLIRRYKQSVTGGGASMTQRVDYIQSELQAVKEWLQANDPNQGGPSMVELDLRDARL